MTNMSDDHDYELDKTATHSDADRLAQLGLKQELERNFSLPSLIALCLCLMGTWEATSAIIAQALQSGGGPGLFWNFLLAFLFTLAIGASLAEIASIYPTAGGQYHWVTAMHPARGRRMASWLTGWISIGAQAMIAASGAFGPAGMIQALIVLNNESTYVGQRWHAVLIYFALLLYSAVLNIFGDRVLPTVNIVAGTVHVGGWLGILIALAVKSTKNSADFVFVDVYNATGWTDGIAWLIGAVSAVYGFLGYDAAAHLAEELPHASRNVPRAMIGAIFANGIMGFAYVIVILFSTGPLERILATPTGQPFVQIYLDAAKSSVGASIMTVFPMISGTMACVAATTSCSRTLWSFARDRAMPFSNYFAHIDKRNKVPTRAIVIVTIANALVGCIYIGSPQAYNAFFAMAVIGSYMSYLPPIILMLFKSRRFFTVDEFGPFRLNKFVGIFANVAAIIYLTTIIIFTAFPTVTPVNQANMNYSVVVVGGWAIVGLVYFYAKGNQQFNMPIVQHKSVTIVGMAAPHQFEEVVQGDSKANS